MKYSFDGSTFLVGAAEAQAAPWPWRRLSPTTAVVDHAAAWPPDPTCVAHIIVLILPLA